MVNIDSLRISQTSEGGIALINKDAELPSRGVDSIIGVIEEDLDSLSVIIETLNETYGANLTDEDKLFLGTLLDSLQRWKSRNCVQSKSTRKCPKRVCR